jgi:uncharacterized coiled-coil DUF342 family protein
MAEVVGQMKQKKHEAREEAEKERAEDEKTLREKLTKEAEEKLKRGKKLTWQQFQLLAKDDEAEQD